MPHDKEFEDLFRNRFSDWEDRPPSDGWARIRAAKRRPFYQRPALILGLLFCSLMIFLPSALRLQHLHLNTTCLETPTTPTDPTSSTPTDHTPTDPMSTDHTTSDRRAPIGSSPTASHIFKEGIKHQKYPSNRRNQAMQPSGQTLSQNNSIQPAERITLPNTVVADKDYGKNKRSYHAKQGNAKHPFVVLESNEEGLATEYADTADKAGNKQSYFVKQDLLETSDNRPFGDSPFLWMPTESLTAIGLIASQTLPRQVSPPDEDEKFPQVAKPVKRRRFSGYSIGLFVAPRYSFNRYIPNTNDELVVKDIKSDHTLSKRLGFGAGIILNKMLTKKISLSGGLTYLNVGETLRFQATSGTVDSVGVEILDNNTIGLTPYYKTATYTYATRYNYAGLQFAVSYHILKTFEQDLYIVAGANTNLLVKGVTTIHKAEGLTETLRFPTPNNPFEQLNYAINFGLGFARRVTPAVELTCEPTISYFLGSTFKRREPIGLKPYSLGLSIGIRIGEKKMDSPQDTYAKGLGR